MKITNLKLRSYLHFAKGLEIDLTYPKGHERAGEPLTKVCFLGQSGTGKTALLNLIKYFVCENFNFSRTGIDDKEFVSDGVELCFKVDGKHFSKVSAGEQQFEHWDRNEVDVPKRIDYVKPHKEYLDHVLKQCAPLLISFPFSIVNPNDLRDDEKLRTLNKESGELEAASTQNRRVWDFDAATIKAIWNLVFTRVESYLDEYQINKLRYFDQISSDTEQAKELVTEFKQWEKDNPNPIQELAEKCLDPVLQNFQLSVETDLSKYETDTVSGKTETYVIVKDKNGREIAHPFLSTGTKQVMLTAIPLFFLKPENSIILFDQPETSIYPNVQCMLPDVYLQSAGASNQFFFATHSPIIASAFDPWEVVELQFTDAEGIRTKDYFEGERHVDNYRIKPKLLDWVSIYRILFGVQDEGNEARTEKLMELAALENEIKRTSDQASKYALAKKYDAIASELDWSGL